MSLKDRLNININTKTNIKKDAVQKSYSKPNSAYDTIFEKIINENTNILVCSPINIPTYTALNFLCSRISNDRRLVGIGANLLLNPSEIIKFEPDKQNLSKELIKTAVSLKPFKIILQDFDGVEAVDIFKMINSNIKNIISAVNAQNAEKALKQMELNLYMNGVHIPETLMKEMITELVDNIIVIDKSGETPVISKIYAVQGLKNNEYQLSDVYSYSKSGIRTKVTAEEIISSAEGITKAKRRNILAEKLKRKKINNGI